MNKKLWKRIAAFVMTCAIATSTAVPDTALAASSGNKKSIVQQQKPTGKSTVENDIAGNLQSQVKSVVLNKILGECEEVDADGALGTMKKGQMLSVQSNGGIFMAIMPNGDLYCWGYNEYGQVGNGTTRNQKTPVKVLNDVKSVSYSYSYCTVSAITENGDLYCWGHNEYGQIGNGATENQTTPIRVLSDVKSVSYSYSYSASHSCVSAITENGDLYCWGYNQYGQVGNGTTKTQITPIKVLSDVKSVFYSYSGANYTSTTSVSAITRNGDLYCWGWNQDGAIGNGTTNNQTTPVKILSDVKSVSFLDTYSDYPFPSFTTYRTSVLAITENGDLFCWGHNEWGQVGNGTTENQTTPVKVLGNVKSVSYSGLGCSDFISVSAVTDNGDLYCWGCNAHGQIGNNRGTNRDHQTTPIKVLSDVKSISYSRSGYADTSVSVITENGDLYCWGCNKSGQVGNGTTMDQNAPIKILSNVKSVFYSDGGANFSSVSAITDNGDLYCWGYNNHGQIGNGNINNQTIPIKVLSDVKSISYSCSDYDMISVSAITKNGDLYCWGFNEDSRVGDGTAMDQSTPIKVLDDVKSVSYSFYSYFHVSVSAITENGDLYCWGYNQYGQVGNGTTENQTTPTKVLGDVSSVFSSHSILNYSTNVSVLAITENGDLYCWGHNDYGQVGNETTENQLSPILIMGPSLSPGLSKDGCLQIPDSITVEKGKSKYFGGKILVDNLDLEQQKEINESLKVVSANPSVATADRNPFDLIMDNDGRYTMQLSIGVTGISRGETDIFVSASDGSKVCCHVVVSKPTETIEEPDETGYSYCFGIAGELQDVNYVNHTMKIDGVSYEASSDSIISDAKKILEQSDNKIIACQVRAADNQIVQVDDVRDIIGKPAVRIKPEVNNINYENGKISKKSFKIDLEMYCTIKEPYSLSDISDAIKKIDGLEVDFSKVSLITSYNNTGEIPFLLKDGLFGSQESSLEKTLDFKLKPWQTKKISITAYVKDDLLIKSVNANAVIEAKVNDDKKTKTTETVHLSNLDKSREEEQKKLAASPKSTELKKASNILNGIQVAYPESDLYECLTGTEVKAISAQVYNWIYTLNALNVIINDDSDSSVLKKLMKKFGLTKEALQNKVLKKMGIDKNVIPWIDSYAGTLQFEAKDKNTGKKITIKFTADMSLYTLGGLSYAGWGTLKYKISSGGSGQGQIAYTNLDNFIESLKKVVDSQMHNCFNKIYADEINEIFNESVADSLISSTFGKLVNEKYGSASEAVYTGLKYAFTGYTEEDAKKSVKDIVIILSKEAVNRYTKISDRCPVDVTVYDGDGNICAEIKDDVVDEKYQDVVAYVEGEDKYLLLPDADYIICYSGNDIGTMDYTVTEYENGEAVRELTYNDVPLTAEKKYVNYLISGRHQGIFLYNLNQVDGGIVEATSDIDKTKEQDISAKSITLNDKTLSLKKGENYILMETISPDDVSTHDITWSSSNDDVVEVSSSGVLYAKADGEAVITVKINGQNLSDSCKVTVVEGNVSSPTPDASLAPEPTRIPDNPYTPYMPIIIPGSVPTVTPAPSAAPSVLPTLDPSEEPSDMPSNTPEVTPSEEPTVTPEPSIAPGSSSTSKADNKKNPAKSLKKGAMVSDSKTKAVYKVTGTGKNKTVEYVRSTKKNASKITVPAKVKLKGQNYKVTSIAKNAFKNNKKLSYVIIGKNVKKIGKKAFYGCKKLRYIYVKSKKLVAKNIGKQAFGNGYPSPRVKSAKSIWRRYARILPAKGLSKRAVYIINPVKLVL